MSGGLNPGIPSIFAEPVLSMATPWWIAIGCFAAIVALMSVLFVVGVIV